MISEQHQTGHSTLIPVLAKPHCYERIVAKGLAKLTERFFLYGVCLLVAEVVFHSIVKLGRSAPPFISWAFQFDWRIDPAIGLNSIYQSDVVALYGVTSLWMMPVYGLISVLGVEPTFEWCRRHRLPFYLRGFVYAGVICAFECLLGWALRGLTGLSIWYYADEFAFATYTSFAIAPIWFIVGLGGEPIIKRVARFQSVSSAFGAADVPFHAPRRFSEKTRQQEAVVVLHGIWLNRGWMRNLIKHCQNSGFDTVPFDYGTWTETTEDVIGRLVHLIDSIDAPRIHILAHSTGALFALEALRREPRIEVERIVTLGAPLGGSRLARLAENLTNSFTNASMNSVQGISW